MTVSVKDLIIEIADCARYGELSEINELIAKIKTLSETITTQQIIATQLPTNKNTALHYACANNHIDVINFILPNLTPAQINQGNVDGSTALHWGALNGWLQVCDLLIKHGADGRIQNNNGLSPVTLAEQQNHLKVVELLLNSFNPEEEQGDDGEEEEVVLGNKEVETEHVY